VSIDWKDRTDGKTEKIPFDYKLTMQDNVKIISDWMKSYNQKYDIRYIVMYHAAKNTASVLEKGLLPGNKSRRNFGMSKSGYVYLAVTPVIAKTFGDMAHNGSYVIYEVIVPVGKLLPDTGRLQHTTPEGIKGRGLVHSLVYAGSARVKGNIERWQIKRYDEKLSLMAQVEKGKQKAKAHSPPDENLKKSTERSW